MSDEPTSDEVLEDAVFESRVREATKKLDAINPFESPVPTPPEPDNNNQRKEDDYKQWASGGNGRYMPVGGTVLNIPPGIYEAFATPSNWGLECLDVSSDEIYELPDMATNMVIEEADRFWSSEHKYRKHNLLYKRGLLLYGPPGSGKTVTIKLLMNKLVNRGGIVILVHNVNLTSMCLKALRKIEPTRNLICIFEDIDEIMAANGESTLLSVLDGENNVDKVMNIATTNYPERLGPRIINRPSRFDRRVRIGMPNDASRREYIRRATGNDLSEEILTQWVSDTNEMSIAHLRELVAAVYCLDQPYDEVIARLKEMAVQVKPDEDFKRQSLGFGASAKNTSRW